MKERRQEYQGIGMTSQRTRERMVNQLRDKGIQDERVLEAMRTVPRHMFVDEALASHAYDPIALPIGHSQTISQPYTVARMTELLISRGMPSRVLEIGTGSGYQSAILAALVEKVFSVERIRALQDRARGLLGEMGYRNISFRYANGEAGWKEHGPYDAILVAAASAEIPAALLDQLAVGGIMLIPIETESHQRLQKITRTNTECVVESIESVSFVPLLSGVI